MYPATIEHFMWQAIHEGRKALPQCRPNPPVGCVLVRDNEIIAAGHTNAPGRHHAEAMALSQLEDAILADVLAFVTLEPCSFFGRTPSCAKALLARQIKEIYVGIIDPDPRNNGAGIALLRAGGVNVRIGILAEVIQQELGPYLATRC